MRRACFNIDRWWDIVASVREKCEDISPADFFSPSFSNIKISLLTGSDSALNVFAKAKTIPPPILEKIRNVQNKKKYIR